MQPATLSQVPGRVAALLLTLAAGLLLGGSTPWVERVPEGELAQWLAAGERYWISHCRDGRGSGLSAYLHLIPDRREERRGSDLACPRRRALLRVASCQVPPQHAAYRLPDRCATDLDFRYDWEADWRKAPRIPNDESHPRPTGPARVALRHFEPTASGLLEVREVYDVSLTGIERVHVQRAPRPAEPRPWLPWRPEPRDLHRLEAAMLSLRADWRADPRRRFHRVHNERWNRLDAAHRAASCARWQDFRARYRADSVRWGVGWERIEESRAGREIRILPLDRQWIGSGAGPLRIRVSAGRVEGELATPVADEPLRMTTLPGVDWSEVLARLEAGGIWELPPPDAWPREVAAAECRGSLQGWLLETSRGGISRRVWYGRPGMYRGDGDPRGPAATPLRELFKPLPEAA